MTKLLRLTVAVLSLTALGGIHALAASPPEDGLPCNAYSYCDEDGMCRATVEDVLCQGEHFEQGGGGEGGEFGGCQDGCALD